MVCLANSRKWSGRCIAGKIMTSKKWIRPISSRVSEEISEEERRYENGKMPRLLDIIRIPVISHQATMHQTENYIIDNEYYWEKIETLLDGLKTMLDTPTDLWGTTTPNSYNGKHDRVPENNEYRNSLYLIKPTSLNIIVRKEFNAKRKVRAEFSYKNIIYNFTITDPIIERQYLAKADNTFNLPIENRYLCVSLGLPFNSYCYKLVASIIEIT